MTEYENTPRYHLDHLLAYEIQASRDLDPLTRLASVYWLSWMHPSKAQRTHATDARVAAWLGCSTDDLGRLRDECEGTGRWAMDTTALPGVGAAPRYLIDPRAEADAGRWQLPRGWDSRWGWDSRYRTGMKWVARYAVDLDVEARVTALVLASLGMRIGDPGSESPWVAVDHVRAEYLLPDVDMYAALDRLEHVIEQRWTEQDRLYLRWTPDFQDVLRQYASTWFARREPGSRTDAETVYEQQRADLLGVDITGERTFVLPTQRGSGDDAERAWHLYALIDPRSGSVFYVGITTRPIEERLREHLEREGTGMGTGGWRSGSHDHNVPVRERIGEILTSGAEPAIRRLATVVGDRAAAEAEEERVVVDLASAGVPLLNRQYLVPGLHPRDFERRAMLAGR